MLVIGLAGVSEYGESRFSLGMESQMAQQNTRTGPADGVAAASPAADTLLASEHSAVTRRCCDGSGREAGLVEDNPGVKIAAAALVDVLQFVSEAKHRLNVSELETKIVVLVPVLEPELQIVHRLDGNTSVNSNVLELVHGLASACAFELAFEHVSVPGLATVPAETVDAVVVPCY